MTGTVRVAVPRKGRPLEAVLDRVGEATGDHRVADDISSTLRYEKAVAKGTAEPDAGVYERLASYSDVDDPYAPEYTVVRDDREGMPRRVVFDSVSVDVDGVEVLLVGREEPFRALRTHTFPLGFDSADLMLEEVVPIREEGLDSLAVLNERIDPHETDVRVESGLGDTVYHTLLARPEVVDRGGELDRSFVESYAGPICISPRYERLVEAVLGSDALRGVSFAYPDEGREEEASIADVGLGVYLTVTGSTAREHGLLRGERLFPSETVLMKNISEMDDDAAAVVDALVGDGADLETSLAI